MTTIYLLRHGEVHNPQGVLYGRLPRFGLSAHGRSQVEAAAVYLQDRPLAALFSSPLLRARQSAAILAACHPGLPVRQTALLNEIHTPHQGRPIAELEAEGWRLFANVPPPYEQPADVLARALRWVRRVLRGHPGQEVAAVSHGDVILALHFWALGRDPFDDHDKAQARYPALASISTLAFADGATEPVLTYHKPY